MKKIVKAIFKKLFTNLNRFELKLGLVKFGNYCVLVYIL